MKPVKNGMVIGISVLFAVCVLALSGLVAVRAGIGWKTDVSSTVYAGSSTVSSAPPAVSSKPVSSQTTPSEPTGSDSEPASSVSQTSSEPAVSRVGRYKKGSDVLEIVSDTDGYIDATLSSQGITMEFGGQPVDEALTATGTDSNNNTVRVTLIFVTGGISVQTEPVIHYEETTPVLTCTGVFRK